MKYYVTPWSTVFLVLTVFSGLLAISSTNWIFVFSALVLNTAVVVPNFIQLSLFGWKSGESAGKYFLVQAKASAAYAMGSAVYWHWDVGVSTLAGLTSVEWGLVILFASLIVKVGAFPFYAWVPGVMLGLSWFNCWLVLTWQKFFPLILLTQVMDSASANFLFGSVGWVVSVTAVLGALLGQSQTNLRSLIGYSSLVHGSWSLLAAMLSAKIVVLYLLVYSVTLGSSVFLFSRSGGRSVQSLRLFGQNGSMATCMSVLSLAGSPPLLGFLGKWLIVSQWGTGSLMTLPLVAALFSSFVSLNYYLSICWGAFWASAFEVSLDRHSEGGSNTGMIFMLNVLPAFFGLLLLDLI